MCINSNVNNEKNIMLIILGIPLKKNPLTNKRKGIKLQNLIATSFKTLF